MNEPIAAIMSAEVKPWVRRAVKLAGARQRMVASVSACQLA
jgi:hypothetical protein